MAAKLKIYLAGPIRGCSPEQRTWWRQEVKQELKRDFDFEDPTDWTDDFVVSREMEKLEACDILLANMWKESIGTTLGIVRARHWGKPVVLVDPNRIHNAILAGLVAPELPVHTLAEAYARLRELSRQFRPFLVRKKNGNEEEFDTRKLVESVALAVAAAGASDAALEKQISGPVIAKLRLRGGEAGLLETGEIRQAVFEQLEWMAADPGQPLHNRVRVRTILEAWEKREGLKDAEREIIEARQAVERLTAECGQLRAELVEKEARLRELERRPPAEPESLPGNLVDALRRAGRDFADCLVIHDEAIDSAVSSPYAHVDRAWKALELLGNCAQERRLARLSGEDFIGVPRWFETHREEAPWLEYAAKEGQVTGTMFRKERTVTYEGVKLFAEQHLCLGDSYDPKHCLRIHFAVHDDKVVVAHCGRHLPTVSST